MRKGSSTFAAEDPVQVSACRLSVRGMAREVWRGNQINVTDISGLGEESKIFLQQQQTQ